MWPLRSLKVRNPFLNLTWPGDLTFGDLELKFWHKVCNSILSRYWKNGGAARRRFFAIREKPEGRAFFAPPPPVRVLRWVKTGRRCAPPFFRYPRKTWGRRSNAPLSRARVNPPPPGGRGSDRTLLGFSGITSSFFFFFYTPPPMSRWPGVPPPAIPTTQQHLTLTPEKIKFKCRGTPS